MGRGWPFVGRSEEINQAVSAVLDEPSGGGFMLTGDPEVGKSGLLREVLRRLTAAGCTVVEMFAGPATSTMEFGALVHLLPSGTGAVDDPQRLFTQLFAMVRAESTARRVVLAVDDAHLLDPLSAALVYAAVHSGVASLAATRRAGESLHASVSALWREDRTVAIAVAPLPEPVVWTLLGEVLDGPVDAATARRLWRLAHGSVLVLREVVEALTDRGAFVRTAGGWHWSGDTAGLITATTEMIARRIAQQPAAVRTALRLVALAEPVGRRAVTGLAGEGAVRRALDSELVLAHRDGRRTVLRVAHPLYRDVALRRMDDDERGLLIGRLVRDIRAHGERRREDVMRLATWHVEYGSPASPETLSAAARLAYCAHDLESAIRLGRAAVRAGAGFDAVELLATALGFTGAPEAAIAMLDAVEPALAGEAERIRWHLSRELIEFNMLHDVGAVERLQEAVLRLRDEGRDILLSLGACLLASRGDVGTGWAALSGLLADPAASTGARLHAGAMAAGLAAVRGEPGGPERLRAVEESAGEQAAQWPTLAATVEFARWTLAYITGRTGPGTPGGDAMRFFPVIDAGTLIGQAIALRMRGRLGGAFAAAQAARSAAEVGGQVFLSVALAETAAVAALRGDAAEARRALAEADRAYRPTMALQYPMLELARVHVLAAERRPADAVAAARALAGRLRHDGLHGHEAHALHALARLDALEPADADRLAELGDAGGAPFCAAAAAHAAALLAGDADGLLGAVAAFDALDHQLFGVEAAAQRLRLLLAGAAPGAGAAAADLVDRLARCEVRAVPALRLPVPELTAREREVADLVERGHSADAIGAALVIEKRSVDSHLYRIYRKFGVHSIDDLPGMVRLLRTLPR